MSQIIDERDMSHESLKQGVDAVREISSNRRAAISRGVDRLEDATLAMGAVSQSPEVPQAAPAVQPEPRAPYASDAAVDVETAREALRKLHGGN